jgi:hypothetical protein
MSHLPQIASPQMAKNSATNLTGLEQWHLKLAELPESLNRRVAAREGPCETTCDAGVAIDHLWLA